MKEKNHVSHVTCHMSHVTFRLALTPKATDLLLLTPPLFTVDKQKTLINHGQKLLLKFLKIFIKSCGVDDCLDLESSEPDIPTLFYEERQKT